MKLHLEVFKRIRKKRRKIWEKGRKSVHKELDTDQYLVKTKS